MTAYVVFLRFAIIALCIYVGSTMLAIWSKESGERSQRITMKLGAQEGSFGVGRCLRCNFFLPCVARYISLPSNPAAMMIREPGSWNAGREIWNKRWRQKRRQAKTS